MTYFIIFAIVYFFLDYSLVFMSVYCLWVNIKYYSTCMYKDNYSTYVMYTVDNTYIPAENKNINRLIYLSTLNTNFIHNLYALG